MSENYDFQADESAVAYKTVIMVGRMRALYDRFESAYAELGSSAQDYLDETLTEHDGMHANMPGVSQSLYSLPASMKDLANMDGDLRVKIFEAEQSLAYAQRDEVVSENISMHTALMIEAIDEGNSKAFDQYVKAGFCVSAMAESVLLAKNKDFAAIMLKEFPETVIEFDVLDDLKNLVDSNLQEDQEEDEKPTGITL